MKKVVVLLMLVSGICHAQTYDEYCMNGSRLCANGRYKEAIENFKVAIEMDSMNGYAYQGRALVEDKMGNYKAAINDYTWYMVLSKDSAMGCIWRAEIERNIGKYRHALADCNASLKLRPGFIHALCLRGDTKFVLKDYKGAIADYDSVLMIDSVSLYQYFFHRAAARYMIMDYAGGTFDKQNGEYFAGYIPSAKTAAPHPIVADAYHIIAKTRPVAANTHPVTVDTHHGGTKTKTVMSEAHSVDMRPQAIKIKAEAYQVKAEPQKAASGEPFKNKWLDGFQRDSIFTQLRLSKAIATESDKAPLYAARGLIAHLQGRTSDACTDFMKAKEMGYTEADEMINVYCK